MKKPTSGNKPSAGLGIGPRPRIAAWVHHHRQAASDSLHKLTREPMSTFLTWLVVGIALALPTALLVILDNVDQLSGDIQGTPRLSLLMTADAPIELAERVATDLQSSIDIRAAVVVPRDQALQEFAEAAGLVSLVASLSENPLPHTVVVEPRPDIGAGRLASLARDLAQNPAIGEVVFDTEWLARLLTSLEIARRLVLVLGVLMLVGAVLILANTIRLAIEARRDEIVVIKLIGGGDGFARRPFLYTGLWFGVGGGLLAALLVALVFGFLSPPTNELLRLYGRDPTFSGLSLVGVLRLVLVGGVLGLLSAGQASALHLRRVEPR